MSDTVFINGCSVMHGGSDGLVMTISNVCFCPPTPPVGFIPAPLPNNAKAQDLEARSCAQTVTIGGQPIALEKSSIATSTGDATAKNTTGGLISTTAQGIACVLSTAKNVLIEGQGVACHGDLLTLNHLTATGPGNTPPAPYLGSMCVNTTEETAAQVNLKDHPPKEQPLTVYINHPQSLRQLTPMNWNEQAKRSLHLPSANPLALPEQQDEAKLTWQIADDATSPSKS